MTIQNVAVYLRVSTEEQVEKFGLQAQQEAIEAKALADGLTIVATYADKGISGAKDETAREGLNQLIDDAKRGKFEIVLAYDSLRIARDMNVKGYILHTLKKAGVKVLYVSGNNDENSIEGVILNAVMDALDHVERLKIVERTTRGRDSKAKKDGDAGGRLPYGYRRVYDNDGNFKSIELSTDDTAIATIRTIFELKADGLSLRKIAQQITDMGYPTPRGGQKWYASSLREILKNEGVYRGDNRVVFTSNKDKQNFTSDTAFPIILGGK